MCRRARAGCSSTAARRRQSGSSTRSSTRSEETGEKLEEPERIDHGPPAQDRSRFSDVASTAFKTYPKRTALGLALFIGQAFIYNSVTFGLGTFLVEFYDISDAKVPLYIVLFAV